MSPLLKGLWEILLLQKGLVFKTWTDGMAADQQLDELLYIRDIPRGDWSNSSMGWRVRARLIAAMEQHGLEPLPDEREKVEQGWTAAGQAEQPTWTLEQKAAHLATLFKRMELSKYN